MKTDVVEQQTRGTTDVVSVPPIDPLEHYISEATMPPRRLRSKDELAALREEAMKGLEERYGTFTPEMVVNIANPLHRFMILGEMGATAWGRHTEMDKHRTRRTSAIQILTLEYGWKPMQIVRAIEAEDRRVVDNAIMNSDGTQVPQSWGEDVALRIAKESHATVERLEGHGEFARPLRDDMVHDLALGRWLERPDGTWERLSDEEMHTRRETGQGVGMSYTNAEIARFGKMSTAMVTLIRKGSTPAARRAARAA